MFEDITKGLASNIVSVSLIDNAEVGLSCAVLVPLTFCSKPVERGCSKHLESHQNPPLSSPGSIVAMGPGVLVPNDTSALTQATILIRTMRVR